MIMSTHNTLFTTLQIFTRPVRAFSSISNKPTYLFPLLLVNFSFLIVYLLYFYLVDYEWYINTLVGSRSELTDAELMVLRERYEGIPSLAMALITTASILVAFTVLFIVQAVLLSLLSRFSGAVLNFKRWLSLSCWCGVVFLIGAIAMLVNLLLSDNGQVGIQEINPLALRNLGLHANSSDLQALYDSIDLPVLWYLGLVIAGFHRWTNAGIIKATLLVLSPYLLLVGAWLLIA